MAGSFDGIIDTVSAKHEVSQLLPLLKVKHLITWEVFVRMPTPSLFDLLGHMLPLVSIPGLRQGIELGSWRADEWTPDPAGSASRPALLFCRRSALQEVCLCTLLAQPYLRLPGTLACLCFEGSVTQCDGS